MTEPISDAEAFAANAAKAAERIDAVLTRHAGWQIEYDIQLVLRDRKRLLAEVDRLTAENDRLFADWQTERASRETFQAVYEEIRAERIKALAERDQAREIAVELLTLHFPKHYLADAALMQQLGRHLRIDALPDWLTGNGAETAETSANPEKLPAEQWCERYGLEIRDPDGWRGPNQLPWDTPITLSDFWTRFGQSTVSGLDKTTYNRVIEDVRKATP